MRVLVLGAGGFIGGRIAAHLLARGHDVLPCGRDAAALRRRFPGPDVARADLARDTAADWPPRLAGLDAVVNAAGALRGADLEAVHVRGPMALFDACAAAGIARVVQISALGADAAAWSRFHLTKRAADEHLLGLRAAAADGRRGRWCVLRPSLVVGRGGRSTALFAALAAALPRPVRLGPGTWRVQPLHVADLARAVAELLEAPGPVPARLDLVGPEPMTTDALTRTLRAWLGLPEAPFVPLLPTPLLRAAAAAGDLLPAGAGGLLGREALGMLAQGNTADPRPAAEALPGRRPPRPLAAALAKEPAVAADRWHARLLPVRPALRLGLAAVWIGSGLVSAFVAPLARSHALLAGLGLRGAAATAATLAGAALDVALGLALLLLPRRTRPVGAAQIGTMLLFTVLATAAAPAAWADPFGPLLKNLAVLAATLALVAVAED